MKAFHILFSGRVQGVGFRAFAARTAKENHLTGFVKNKNDGSVEMVIQGDNKLLSKCLEEIKARFKEHIDDIKLSAMASAEKFEDFQIIANYL